MSVQMPLSEPLLLIDLSAVFGLPVTFWLVETVQMAFGYQRPARRYWIRADTEADAFAAARDLYDDPDAQCRTRLKCIARAK